MASFKKGNKVRVNKQIERNLDFAGSQRVPNNKIVRGIYAVEGETGTVLEVFKGKNGKPPSDPGRVTHVKVQIDEQWIGKSDTDQRIKTFRMTSLDLI